MKNKIKNGAKECEVVDFEVQCNTTRLKLCFSDVTMDLMGEFVAGTRRNGRFRFHDEF